MTRKVASPKSTGGGGYAFEDKVCAYWLTHLLAGRSVADADLGAPQRVRFQCRVDGWLVDDILVEYPNRDEKSVRLAASLKSNRQVVANRLPAEFVADAWSLVLNPGTTAYDPEADILSLVTIPLAAGTRESLNTLLDMAKHQQPEELARNIAEPGFSNDAVRTLYESASCPADVAEAHGVVTAPLPGVLLRSVRIISYDFENVPSEDKTRALALCRELLSDEDVEKVDRLWDRLQTIARDARVAAGSLGLAEILNRLRPSFDLKSHPSYGPDLDKLRRISDETQGRIYTHLGGDDHAISLLRIEAVENLTVAIRENPTTVLLGESGTGKSASIVLSSMRRQLPGLLLMYDAVEFSSLCTAVGSRAAGLRHPIDEVLHAAPWGNAVLCLDGMEKIVEEPRWADLARVLRSIVARQEYGGHRIVLTCQTVSWKRVAEAAARHQVPLGNVTTIADVGLSDDDLNLVKRTFPHIAPLLNRSDLDRLFRLPRALDHLICGIGRTNAPGASEWRGESDLNNWYWIGVICDHEEGADTGRALVRLAELQADRYLPTIPVTLSELEPYRSDVLRTLADRGAISIDREQIRFRHDHTADLARERWILGQRGPGLSAILRAKVANPLWYGAIRILSADLLETGDSGEWERLLAEFDDGSDEGRRAANLFLDSLYLAVTPALLLDRAIALLSKDDGTLLKRLLQRFVIVATQPNRRMLDFIKELYPEGEPADLALQYREPVQRLWPEVIGWMYQNRQMVVDFAPDEIIKMGDLWLGLTEEHLRRSMFVELSRLVMDVVERAAAPKSDWRYHVDKDLAYKVLCFAVLGDFRRGFRIIEQLSGIRVWPGETVPTMREDHFTKEQFEYPPPWSDGPIVQPDHEFRRVMLKDHMLTALVTLEPKFAAHVFLALTIEPPTIRTAWSGRDSIWDLRTEGNHDIEAPEPTFLPLVRMLELEPITALWAILRLVDFASDRWIEMRWDANVLEHPETSVGRIELMLDDTPRQYLGGFHQLRWHRSAGAPDIVAAALMCLEKWLYDLQESNALHPFILDSILRCTRSVAVLGVLASLAKKHPELLDEPLEPLVTSPYLMFWSRLGQIDKPEMIAGIGMLGITNDERRWNRLRDWHTMPHRKLVFENVVVERWFRRGGDWPAVENARSWWMDSVRPNAPAGDQRWIEGIARQFDMENWSLQDNEDGDVLIVPERVAPPMTQEAQEELDQADLGRNAMLFPFRCCQILDGESPVDSILPESLLKQSSQLAKKIGNLEEQAVRAPADFVAGAFTVILLKHPEWLKSNPNDGHEIVGFFKELGEHAYVSFNHVERCQVGRVDSWDAFASDAIPALWKETPDDDCIRRFAGKLACGVNDTTVGRLLGAVVREFGLDSQEIQSVSYLVARFARLLILCMRMQDLDDEQRNSAVNRLIEDFVEGRLGPLPENWDDVVSLRPPELFDHLTVDQEPEEQTWETADGVHDEYLFHAFSWLYIPDRVARGLHPFEQRLFIGLWRVLLRCRESWAREEPSSRFDLRGGRPFTEALAHALLVGEESDFSDEVFREFGAHESVDTQASEHVLTSLARIGFGDRSLWERTVGLLRTAFTALGAARAWDARTDRNREVDDLLCATVGLDKYGVDRWTAERRELVGLLAPLLAEWSAFALDYEECARQFTRFLTSEAAVALRKDGILWLARSEKRGWWRGSGIAGTLVRLLALFLRESSEILLRDESVRRAFIDLVQYAVSVGEPAAVALEEQMRVALGMTT